MSGSRGDLDEIKGPFDLVIEASAEPSVHAGQGAAGLTYLLEMNLFGAINALDLCRRIQSPLVFLSTSRVFSISALRSLPLIVAGGRFELDESKSTQVTRLGLDESFPAVGQSPRSLYGATKIAAEIFVEEYAHAFDLPSVINRCGFLCGPGQFGRTDQGVFTLWVAHHVLDKPLR